MVKDDYSRIRIRVPSYPQQYKSYTTPPHTQLLLLLASSCYSLPPFFSCIIHWTHTGIPCYQLAGVFQKKPMHWKRLVTPQKLCGAPDNFWTLSMITSNLFSTDLNMGGKPVIIPMSYILDNKCLENVDHHFGVLNFACTRFQKYYFPFLY